MTVEEFKSTVQPFDLLGGKNQGQFFESLLRSLSWNET